MGRHKGDKNAGRGLWLGYHSNGINGCVGFKLALDDSGGHTVFLSVIGRFPSITQSLSPSPCSCNLFLNLLPFLSESPTRQFPPLPSSVFESNTPDRKYIYKIFKNLRMLAVSFSKEDFVRDVYSLLTLVRKDHSSERNVCS